MARTLPHLLRYLLLLAAAAAPTLRAQEAISSINRSRLAGNSPAVEAVRTPGGDVPIGDIPLGPGGDDDSFGAQVIMKSEPRVRPFQLFANTSAFFTSNVALTQRGAREDLFAVGTVGAAWRPIIAKNGWDADIGVRAAAFRYSKFSELDFHSLGAGAGAAWRVPRLAGATLFARYDFIQLLNSGGGELLQDHTFSAGAQKAFALGRAHALTTGVSAMAGFSNPGSQERDQVGAFVGYQVQLSRGFDAAVSYRYAAQFYDGGRLDHNQTLSLGIAYTVAAWLRLEASVSAAWNGSNNSVFDYQVLNSGGGLALNVRF